MNHKNHRVVIWVLALLPVAVTAAVYPSLPSEIPTHWGIDGTVTYGGRYTIWFIALMSPLFAFLFPLMRKIDPRRTNYAKFTGAYNGFIIALLLFLLAMNLTILSETFYPGRLSMYRFVMVAVGLLFAFLGYLMPQAKSNFFFGVRTPWTLSDIEVWDKTHKLAGHLFLYGGIFMIAMPFVLPEQIAFWALMALVFVLAGVPSVMSYLWYHRKSDHPA